MLLDNILPFVGRRACSRGPVVPWGYAGPIVFTPNTLLPSLVSLWRSTFISFLSFNLFPLYVLFPLTICACDG